MQYCKKCVTPITRPRVEFDKDGICNACIWAEKKKSIDWDKRRNKLHEICDKFRSDNVWWDVIVPCSGGKDGSYVAWKLKHEFNMHPLCVTFSPPIQTGIGRKNLENFRNSGFDLIEIRPNPDVYRRLCRRMFIEHARVKFPFVIGIATAVAQMAIRHNVPFIMWGEQGEEEYGGDTSYNDDFFMNRDFVQGIYHEGHDMMDYLDEFTHLELSWWKNDLKGQNDLRQTWWSKYESWDDQLHRDLAVSMCGLSTSEGEVGTFTNYAQLDDVLQDLHQYEMFIKFGHGRATADCNLAIHDDRITRGEAIEIIKEKDGIFPLKYLNEYLQYLNLTEKEFWDVIDFHANKNILDPTINVDRPWMLKKAPE